MLITLLRSSKAYNYEFVRSTTIFETAGAVSKLFNMIILAVVIYKSSQVVGRRRDPFLKRDVSLLTYIRN